MKFERALANVQTVFLDSVVVVYFVEIHPNYADITKLLFEQIGNRFLQA